MPLLPTTTEPQNARGAASSDANGVFDVETLVGRCMGDAGLAAKLLQRFEERLPATIAEIERLLAEGNRSEVVKRAHSLKGEAGSLAAGCLQQAAAELEACLRSAAGAPEQDVLRSAVALKTAAQQCCQRLPELLEALSTPANTA